MPPVLIWVVIAAVTVGVAALLVSDSRRRNGARRLARESAAVEATTPRPMRTDMELIRGWLDESERINSERFDSLKARIFWTPLLWGLIGAALWTLVFVVARS